jgi:hypothetical protein
MCGPSDLVPFEDKIRRARNFVRIESNIGTQRDSGDRERGLEAKMKECETRLFGRVD